MDPWPENEPIIECSQGEERFDLHNCADFVAFAWAATGELSLTFAHRASAHCPGSADLHDALITLRFSGLQRWSVEQEPDWVVEQGDELNYILHLGIAASRSSVEIKVGGLELNFECAGVEMKADRLAALG